MNKEDIESAINEMNKLIRMAEIDKKSTLIVFEERSKIINERIKSYETAKQALFKAMKGID